MYYLKGDLNQIGKQEEFLKNECIGFDIEWEVGFYPNLKTKEEYERALVCIWLDKPAGWWNYKEDLVNSKICSPEDFQEALERQVASRKEREEARGGL